MLKLTKFFLILSLLTSIASAGLGKYLPLKKSHLPAMYKDLGASIKKLEASKNQKLLGEIVEVYIQHHKFDKSYYPYELLAPYYGKNKTQVEKSLKKYKKADRDLAIRNLKIALDELVNGNG